MAPRSLRLVARIFSANARLKKAPESYAHADSAGKPDRLYLSWTDVWVKKDGKWKVRAIHVISERVEPIPSDT